MVKQHLAEQEKGDDCLKAVVNTIKESIRPYDLGVYRYGGEEFAVILPDVDLVESENIGNRLQKKVQEKTSITISIGVSTYRGASNNLHNLLCYADRALYKAKKEGHCCWEGIRMKEKLNIKDLILKNSISNNFIFIDLSECGWNTLKLCKSNEVYVSLSNDFGMVVIPKDKKTYVPKLYDYDTDNPEKIIKILLKEAEDKIVGDITVIFNDIFYNTETYEFAISFSGRKRNRVCIYDDQL